jgi:predicted nucleic acid-binding protein
VNLSPLVLETSTLLNLTASGEMASIVQSLGRSVVICDAARAECRLPIDEDSALVPPDLEDLIQMQAIVSCSAPALEEEDLFVQFATVLADTEALAAAVAVIRNCALASDDRKVRAVFERRTGSDARLLSTPSLLHSWATHASRPREHVRQVLLRIESRARFTPRKEDSACAWWAALVA